MLAISTETSFRSAMIAVSMADPFMCRSPLPLLSRAFAPWRKRFLIAVWWHLWPFRGRMPGQSIFRSGWRHPHFPSSPGLAGGSLAALCWRGGPVEPGHDREVNLIRKCSERRWLSHSCLMKRDFLTIIFFCVMSQSIFTNFIMPCIW